MGDPVSGVMPNTAPVIDIEKDGKMQRAYADFQNVYWEINEDGKGRVWIKQNGKEITVTDVVVKEPHGWKQSLQFTAKTNITVQGKVIKEDEKPYPDVVTIEQDLDSIKFGSKENTVEVMTYYFSGSPQFDAIVKANPEYEAFLKETLSYEDVGGGGGFIGSKKFDVNGDGDPDHTNLDIVRGFAPRSDDNYAGLKNVGSGEKLSARIGVALSSDQPKSKPE